MRHQIGSLFFRMNFVVALSALSLPVAPSNLKSDIDVGFGVTSIAMNAGSLTQNLESLSSIEINYKLLDPPKNLAYGFSFFELIKTQFGSLTFSRFSIGVSYFPMGVNQQRVIYDSGIEGRVLKSTPFAGLYFGIANMSLTELNASAFDLSLKLGLQVPLSVNLVLIGQLSLCSSLPGETTNGIEFSYSGIIATAGIQLSNF